jgi:hypothetical protein
LWNKAKAAAGKGDYAGDSIYRVANSIYTGAGGETKSKSAKRNTALEATAATRMSAKKELQASIKDGGYSFTDLQSNLSEAVCDNPVICPNTSTTNGPCCPCWIADIIAPSHEAGEVWEAIVQGQQGKLFCVSFKMGENNSVVIEGEPKEVERTTDYDYVFSPETPETVTAKKAYAATKELKAGRADDKLKKTYHDAANDAYTAGDIIQQQHEVAASSHRIAAEHAKIAGFQAHAAMHAAHASSHDAMVCSMKAKDMAGHQLACSSHKTAQGMAMTAGDVMKTDDSLKEQGDVLSAKAVHHGLMASAHEAHAATLKK